ncbi:melibiose:sodium transporter MelB [Vibrio mimicus]
MSNISLNMKVSYGIGAFGKDVTCGVVMLYAMFYFTDILGVSPAFIGTLFLVARIWDALNDPLMGILVDKTKSRFGRIKVWLFAGALANTILIIAMFNAQWLEGSMLYLYICVTYILWGMAFTAIEIPFWCILPNVAKSDEEKASLVIWPRSMISVAWMIIGSFFLIAVEFFGEGDQGKGFSMAASVSAVLFFFAMMVLLFNFKEKQEPEDKPQYTLKDICSMLKNNDQLIVIFTALFFFFNIVGTILYFAVYYFTYVVESQELFSMFMLVAGIAEVVSQLIIPFVLKRISREALTKIAYLLPLLGCVVLAYSSFYALHSVILIAIGSILVRMGHGFMLVLMIMMLTDCMDYGELKTGKRAEGVIFAAMPVQFKLGNAATGFIMGIVLTVSGYIPNETQSPETIASMRFLFLVFPALVAGVSYYIYSRFYKLKGEYLKEVKAELAEIKKEQKELSNKELENTAEPVRV